MYGLVWYILLKIYGLVWYIAQEIYGLKQNLYMEEHDLLLKYYVELYSTLYKKYMECCGLLCVYNCCIVHYTRNIWSVVVYYACTIVEALFHK